MDEPKTTCSACRREILQSTADRNGGLCAPCHREANAPPARADFFTPVPPVSRAVLDDLIVSQPPHVVIDMLFNPACDKVNFRPNEMTEGDIIVYTVWTFLGETCNGGIRQYLTNQSRGWAHECGPSLRKIGADKYADIIETCIKAFTDAKSADDAKWESDLEAYEANHDEPFGKIDKHFSEFYWANEEELIDLLFDYICENRDVFAPFRIDS